MAAASGLLLGGLRSLARRPSCPQWPPSHRRVGSYACGPCDLPLLGSTVGQALDAAVERQPDREAFVFAFDGVPRLSRTMAEFKSDVDRLAGGLLAVGLSPGDRIGVWGPNSREWLTLQFAAAKAGLVLVTINPGYRPHELEFCVNRVGMRALVTAAAFKSSDYCEMLASLCPELPSAGRGSLRSAALPTLSHVVVMGDRPPPAGTFAFDEILNAGASDHFHLLERVANRLQMDDVINIQFTSGTTGSPKGAALTHHNILNNAFFVGVRCRYRELPPRICVPVPFYHCFGMGLANLQVALHDAVCVYPAPSFNPGATLRAAADEKCTALYGTPTMLIDLLAHPDVAKRDLSTLRTGVVGGANCPAELMKKIVNHLHLSEMTIAYGTTENSPITFQSLPTDSIERRASTVGRPAPHCEVKVVDNDGRVVPVGQVGEICVRGYCVMRGYFNDDEKTKEVIGEDRWYRTGDIGFLDNEGYGHITGRMKDLVIRGGENLYPAEIENFLHTHPSIDDVHVVGVPDSRMGEELCAVVRLRPGSSLTRERLREFCRGEIAHFKIPRHVIFADEFPLTATGKVQKLRLREIAMRRLGIEEQSAT